MFRLFPLLVIPLIVYNLIALGGGALLHHNTQDILSITHAVSIPMFSGDVWKFSFGDFLVLLALCLLFVEVVKATRTTSREIINHGLSLLVFIIALIESHRGEGLRLDAVLLHRGHDAVRRDRGLHDLHRRRRARSGPRPRRHRLKPEPGIFRTGGPHRAARLPAGRSIRRIAGGREPGAGLRHAGIVADGLAEAIRGPLRPVELAMREALLEPGNPRASRRSPARRRRREWPCVAGRARSGIRRARIVSARISAPAHGRAADRRAHP